MFVFALIDLSCKHAFGFWMTVRQRSQVLITGRSGSRNKIHPVAWKINKFPSSFCFLAFFHFSLCLSFPAALSLSHGFLSFFFVNTVFLSVMFEVKYADSQQRRDVNTVECTSDSGGVEGRVNIWLTGGESGSWVWNVCRKSEKNRERLWLIDCTYWAIRVRLIGWLSFHWAVISLGDPLWKAFKRANWRNCSEDSRTPVV